MWRFLGTAIGFLLFGIGGLLLYLSIFQIIGVCTKDKLAAQKKVRNFLRYVFKCFLMFLNVIGVLEVKTDGLNKIKNLKGSLIICNHPCLLDVVVIMSELKNVGCVVKNQLWKNPLIGGVMRSAGYIRNDLEPQQFLESCQKQIEMGDNILIFPEGTRTVPEQPIKMHRGLGNLALAINADIQTLLMSCTPLTLTKRSKWYEIPHKKVTLKLRVGLFFSNKDYQDERPRSIRVRALMREIQHYYNRYLS